MNRVLIMAWCRGELSGFLGWMLACFRTLDRLSGDCQRSMHLRILRMLRPVEAGVRRLISVEADGLLVAARLRPAGPELRGLKRVGAAGLPMFRLFDPRKCFDRKASSGVPWVSVIGDDDTRPAMPPVAAQVLDFAGLRGRLLAVESALSDLPKQARRLARWRARTKMRRAEGAVSGLVSPMRPGLPPGYRVRGQGKLGEVLLECDLLARRVENARAR